MRRFRATAVRDRRWWSVRVHGLPENYAGFTPGRDLDEAWAMAREATALLLDVPESEVDLDLHVEAADPLLDELAAARQAREAAAAAEQRTRARAARELTEKGISQRDAGRLLGISHQRVAQLASRRAA
jgi:hypothetical protein